MSDMTVPLKFGGLTAITETNALNEVTSTTDRFSTVAPSRIRTRKRSTTATTKDQEKWSKLQNLKDLLDMGFITRTEYRDRMAQIVDEMTGTHTRRIDKSNPILSKGGKDPQGPDLIVIPSPPPDFGPIQEESAIKHVFEIYPDGTKKWIQYPVKIKMDKSPFARGGLRVVHHLMEYDERNKTSTFPTSTQSNKVISPQSSESETNNNNNLINSTESENNSLPHSESTQQTYVAKLAIDPYEDPDTYFKDVEMQIVCRVYAEKFNKYNPPRLVTFNDAWVLQLVDRPGQPLCNVEPYLSGSYQKHNNNCGYVSEADRNTPQAFSHFTYEASDKQLIVVDIQGVSDIYTDPQIHTLDEHIFGKGNLGKHGIDRFLQTHHCNSICRYLKLPPINPKGSMDQGTVPNKPYMAARSIDKMRVEMHHVYQQDPKIRKVVKDEYRYLLGDEQWSGSSNGSVEDLNSTATKAAEKERKSFICHFCSLL